MFKAMQSGGHPRTGRKKIGEVKTCKRKKNRSQREAAAGKRKRKEEK